MVLATVLRAVASVRVVVSRHGTGDDDESSSSTADDYRTKQNQNNAHATCA
jgi:hypothetical protein